MTKRTLKLTVSYDGTDFYGWQRQAAERTVQAVLEAALAPIEGRPVVVTGAGRTDAGVHADGQVASLSLTATIGPLELQRALNATLPPDVRVCEIAEAHADFNARFDARLKTYRYAIWCGAVMPPRQRRYSWHVPYPLDMTAMQSAAALLVGRHDFAAFQAAGSDVQTTVREVTASKIGQPSAPTIDYEITGTGFLRHMVRNIVGTLVDVGRSRLAPTALLDILSSGDRARASATAPPHGLTLVRVEY
jgi:tRNA pseudouridine38-40 synthase